MFSVIKLTLVLSLLLYNKTRSRFSATQGIQYFESLGTMAEPSKLIIRVSETKLSHTCMAWVYEKKERKNTHTETYK